MIIIIFSYNFRSGDAEMIKLAAVLVNGSNITLQGRERERAMKVIFVCQKHPPRGSRQVSSLHGS